MAWTAPITWVAGAVPTAAVLNTQIRDNFLQTMPAKATSVGSIFVGSGANQISERFIDFAKIDTNESTGSTSYANLTTTGPSVTLTTGTSAFVFHSVHIGNDTFHAQAYMSWAISGATTRAALDSTSIQWDGINGQTASGGMMDHLTTLTPGVNTFTAKYRVSAGNGFFQRRIIGVIPIS